MSPELTNLLPPDLVRQFRRDYFLRLGTLATLALTLVVLINAILLFPSRLLLSSRLNIEERHLTELSNALAALDEEGVTARLDALSKESLYFLDVGKAPTFSPLLSAILALSRSGVALTSFSFEPARADVAGRVIVGGIANSRDALRSYVLLLKDVPGVVDASVPLSAYAKEEEISFSATLSLPPGTPSP